MIFVDIDLARRLEAIETWVAAEHGRARLSLWPDRDTAVVEVAGGVACYLGEGLPLNEIRGMGMNGPVAGDDLDRAEEVFFQRGVQARVNVCPMADPSLLAGLASRGYRAASFEDVLVRELDRSEVFAVPRAEILVEAVETSEGVEVCGQVMARGFSAPDEPSPSLREIFRMSSQVEGLVGMLARVGGEPAGAGCLLVRDGLALLCGASTRPEFRRRGVQGALSDARLARAAESGCGLATVGDEPGSGSHRNAERQGFRVAYTKLILARDRA